MSGTGTRKRLLKPGWAWFCNLLIEHWPQILWVIGAGVMTYLATLADWLKRYGPLAWGFVGLGTYLLLVAGYALYGVTRKYIASSRLADERWKAGAINPLEDNFSKQRIKLSDFFNPFYLPIKTVKFQDCEMLGPSDIYFGGPKFFYCHFRDCQIVIVKDKTNVIGVTLLSPSGNGRKTLAFRRRL